MADAPHPLSIIGYWAEPQAPADQSCGWPDPRDLVGTWDPHDRRVTVEHLTGGRLFRVFGGRSSCRMCDSSLGTGELTDGTWAWPEGLEHYVEAHDVVLPETFVTSCRARVALPAWLADCVPERWVQGGSGTAAPMPGQVSAWRIDDTAWLDWAATKTPPHPHPDAVSIEDARAVCAGLSHRTWQASITEAAGRWRIECATDSWQRRFYLDPCAAPILERRLLRYRVADPEGILEVPRANEIAAQHDGAWGALRVLAAQPHAWFFWVRPPGAAWPTEQTVRELLQRPMAPGWMMAAPGGGRSQVIPSQDEVGWRWLLRVEQERAEHLLERKAEEQGTPRKEPEEPPRRRWWSRLVAGIRRVSPGAR